MEGTRKQMWNNKEAELIKLWQQRGCLYDTASRDFRDKSKKQQAWREISEELQIPIGEIITRTASLRTQYGKLMHPKPGGGATKTLTARQKWIRKHMEFLKCHVLPRTSLSTIECELTEEDEEQEEEEQEWAEDMDSFTSSTISSLESNITATPTLTLSTPQRLATSRTQTTTADYHRNMEREKVSFLKHAIKKEDSDDDFGKLVACKMHQITDPLEKLRVEQAITHVLYAALNESMPSWMRQSDSPAEVEEGNEKKEEVVCEKHSGIPSWFCEDEQRAVCPVCEFSLHQSHKVVPVEQAVSELKEQLKSDLKSLQDKRNKYKQVEKKYNNMNEHVKNQVSATERRIRAEFNKLHQFLKEEEESRLAALREEEEQKRKTISRERKRIEEQISSLSDRISAVEEELQKDKVAFLSSYKDTPSRSTTQSSLSDPQLVSGALIDVAKHLGNLSFRVWDKMRDKVHFSPVILDPNTAGGWLHVSDDLTSVKNEDTWQQLPDNPERNTEYPDAFGSEGFSSGTHSWKVEVGDPPDWNVGLVKESVDRNIKNEASPESGHWCLQ